MIYIHKNRVENRACSVFFLISEMAAKPINLMATKPSPLSTLVVILILCILGFYALHHPHSPSPSSSSASSSHLENLFLSTSSNSTIASYLRALTLHPHLAGTKPAAETTSYVVNHFTSLNLQTHTTTYKALLSYPLHSSLSAHFNNGSSTDLPLTEPPAAPGVVPPYHAYSPSGSVYAKAVFVNYGRDEDYRALGVNVSGCIVIVRRGGGLGRGALVEKAEANGAAAVLVYGDGDTWRKGFERGHVMRGVGDPLSPGWAGVEGGESLGVEHSEVLKRFPKIPSLPLSADIADTILSSLGGAPVPLNWRGTLRSKVGVTHVGPGPTMLNFTYLVSN